LDRVIAYPQGMGDVYYAGTLVLAMAVALIAYLLIWIT
jgi:hypothetical protein